MPTSVFVTGATGFIAQHTIKLLISKGYNVVGTVRSVAKGDHLKTLFGDEKFSYEVVADIVSAGAFDRALENHPEVTVFLHTASPVTYKVESVDDELLKPAVEGTKNVLSAIKTHGPQIKHVVITSSMASMLDGPRLKDPTYTLSENSWNPISYEESKANPVLGYIGSKKFAEKAAWEFVESEKPNYTLNFVHPSYVFGPQAFDSEAKGELNLTAELISSFLKLGPDSSIPEYDNFFVDVRDVAKAHLAAFENGFANERLLLISHEFTSQAVLDILNSSFESLKGKLPVGTPGDYSTKPSSKVDIEKTRNLLGFPFMDLKSSVVDSISQILKSTSH